MDWLKGKKTYITAILYAVAALLGELNVVQVPELVFQVLAAVGLISLSAGVSDGK